MSRRASLLPGLLAAAFAAAILWHVSAGAHAVPLSGVWSALTGPSDSYDAVVVTQIRLPRALGAALAGAGLAAAGSLMQGATRNPLAEPGLFGLLAGAALAVVAGQGLAGVTAPGALPLLAAAGALTGALMVWGLAAAAGGGPLVPVLAGAAVTAFLAALTTLLTLLDPRSFESLRIWLSGSLAGLRLPVLAATAPWALAGLAAALVAGPKLTALSMGDAVATGLGLDPRRVRALALLSVVTLTAAAVALAGPLGFVGLTVPHAVRRLGTVTYGALVPLSMALGAIYLVIVDTLARVALAPAEISTGILTALIGAPVFVTLVRARS